MNWKLRRVVVTFSSALLLVASPATFPQSDKKPTVAELLQRLESAEGPGRDRLMEQLDQIQDADVLVPAILAELDRIDPENVAKLLDVLARFPGAHAEAPLVRLAERADQIPRDLEPFLKGDPARNELLQALSQTCASWKPPSKNLDDALLDELAAEDQSVLKSQKLIEWIGNALGQSGSSGLDQLLAMLRDHSACRQLAAKAGLTSNILQSGNTEPRMVSSVTAALSDPDPGVQHTAVSVLEPMIGYNAAPLSSEMLQPLFAILKSNPEFDARRAAFALLKTAPGDTPKKAAELASHDPDGNLQRYAEEFLDQLSAATPDENP